MSSSTSGEDAQYAEDGRPGTPRRGSARHEATGDADLRLLADSAHDFAMIFTDPERNVVRWSKGAEAVLGWNEAEAIGTPVNDLIFTPEDIAAGVPQREQDTALRDGRAEDERWHLKKDGSRFWASGVMVPLYNSDTGALRGFGKVLRDVTEKKRAQDAQSFLAAIVESSQDSIITVDFGGVVTSWNRAAQDLYGYTAAEAIGRPLGTLVFPENLREVLDDIDRVRDSVTVATFDSVRVHKSGRHLTLEVAMSPVRDDRGRVIGVSTVARDVSERRRAEEAQWEGKERQAFLLRLSDALRAEPDADAVADRALRMLSERLRLDRCYVGIYRLAEDRGDFPHQVGNDRVPPLPDGVRLSDFPEALRVAFDRTLVIDDVMEAEGQRRADRQNLDALGLRALVAATLRRGEASPLWSIVAVCADPRRWTPGEVALIEEVTERTWTAIERADAGEALLAHAQRLHLATSATALAVFDWSLVTGRVEGNGRFRELFGLGAGGDIRGAQVLGRLQPETRAFVEERLKAASDPSSDGRYAFEFRVEGRDSGHDSGRDAERWLLTYGQVYFAGDGPERRAVRVLGTGLDITERKRAEEALRESEARIRTLSDAVPQVIWTNEPGGRADYFNRGWYEYTGLSPEQSAGPGWQAVVHPDDASASAQRWQDALSAGVAFDAEYRLRGADGAYRWFIGRNVPLKDGAGRVIGWFGTATDIHELRALREGLEARVAERTVALEASLRERLALVERLVNAQEEERRRISRELHDEMGQILTGFSLGLRNLEDALIRRDPHDEVLPRLAPLRSQADSMGREVHRIAVELRPTALDDVGLAPALEAYAGEWSERTGVPADFAAIGVIGEVGPEGDRLPPLIETTAYRVVQEALNNAAKYAVPGGATSVSVTLQRREGTLLATIEDDGPGFDAEEAARRGRLGLAGMRERAELAGGSLEIETAPGEGTTIYLRLPLA